MMFRTDIQSHVLGPCAVFLLGVSYDTPVLRQADLAVRANEQRTGRESPCCLPAALQDLADGDRVISSSR